MKTVFCLFSALSALAVASGQVVNIPPQSPPFSIGLNVNNGYGAFAQSFRAPAGFNVLENFSFWTPFPGQSAAPYQAYVVKWDAVGQQTIGSPLFSGSGLMTPDASGQLQFTTTPGGVLLDPTSLYAVVMAFPNPQQFRVGIPYSDFDLYLSTNGVAQPSDALTPLSDWHPFGFYNSQNTFVPTNFQFEATFAVTPVPEPETMATWASALLFAIVLSRLVRVRRLSQGG